MRRRSKAGRSATKNMIFEEDGRRIFIDKNRAFHSTGLYVRKYRRGNKKRTIQRNWQHRVHKTTKNTEKLAT
jgi:hypothetical protein